MAPPYIKIMFFTKIKHTEGDQLMNKLATPILIRSDISTFLLYMEYLGLRFLKWEENQDLTKPRTKTCV
jgi:hypothetical protein